MEKKNMEKEIAVPKTFEDKMKDKLKENFSDLISDEEYKAFILKGIEKIFFEREEINIDKWKPYKEHSVMYTLIHREFQPVFELAVTNYVKDNKEEILKELKPFFEQKSSELIVSALKNMFRNELHTYQNNIESRLNTL